MAVERRLRRGWYGSLFLLGVLAAAFLSDAGTAMGYAVEGPVWANGTTSFDYVLPGGDVQFDTAFQQAMADWNAVTSFTFVGVNASADPCSSTGANGVSLSTTECGTAFGSTTLAVTSYNFVTQRNGAERFTHAGTVFNQNKNFSVYSGPLQGNLVDFRRVAVHELGHALGLDHETDPSIPAIMAPSISNIEQPTADDIAGVQSLYGGSALSQTSVISAILPASRSVQVGNTATVFATMINSGSQTATGCSIALASSIPASSSYQTTSAATNQLTGLPNQPVNIATGGSQSFVVSITPSQPFGATDVGFTMACANTPAAPTTTGLNTLLLSSSSTPVPDVVALAATASNDGYVHVPSTGPGAFAVATINLGASGDIVASADTGAAVLPVSITLCQTNPSTGQCISAIGTTVPATIVTNATPTFSIFVSVTGLISPDPANKRIFVRFRDTTGMTRGSTSVAVTTS